MSVFIIVMLKLNIYLSIIATIVNGLAFVAFRKWGDAIAATASIASMFWMLAAQEKQEERKQEEYKLSVREELKLMRQCVYYSGSVILKCAVNPGTRCLDCKYFEKPQERHEESAY